MTGDTIITVNGQPITIEDFYNSIEAREIISEFGNTKEVVDKTTLGIDSELKLGTHNITYAMKHKVKKRMFRIKVGDTHVDVTEDHSVMVLRNNKLISLKPLEISKGDKIIKLIKVDNNE